MNRIRFISALLVIMMLVGALASCGGGSEQIHNDSETADRQSSSETCSERVEDTDGTEKDTDNDTTRETESDTEHDEESDTEPAVELPIGKLDIENGAMIEYADYLAEGANAYYGDSKRSYAVVENMNMTLKHGLSNDVKNFVNSLENKNGGVYI